MAGMKGSSSRTNVVATKRVYLFEDAFKHFQSDRTSMREALGGKGAGLADMTASGVNVPPGMTLLTSCCREYYQNGKKLPEGLCEEVFEELKAIERSVGRTLGDLNKPLLLSVRSGAKFSMPGMMDTI